MAENENQLHKQTTRSSSLPWEIIAQSSLTIAGVTAVLFIVGWAYHSGWYGYYGISMSQVNIPIQQILIQSFVPLFMFISVLMMSILIYAVIFGVGRSLLTIWQAGGLNRLYIKSFSSLAREFSVNDWIAILLITSILNYYIVLDIIVNFTMRYASLSISALNEGMYGVMYMAIRYVVFLLALSLLFFTVTFLLSFFKSKMSYKELVANKTINFLFPIFPNKATWVLGLTVVNFILLMAFSQRYGIISASVGVEGFGNWKMQKVTISYPGSINTPDWMKLGCEQSSCLYGPFGFVAENADSYFLIPLSVNKNNVTPITGVFIIPKSDNVYLMFNNEVKVFLPIDTDIPPLTETPTVIATTSP